MCGWITRGWRRPVATHHRPQCPANSVLGQGCHRRSLRARDSRQASRDGWCLPGEGGTGQQAGGGLAAGGRVADLVSPAPQVHGRATLGNQTTHSCRFYSAGKTHALSFSRLAMFGAPLVICLATHKLNMTSKTIVHRRRAEAGLMNMVRRWVWHFDAHTLVETSFSRQRAGARRPADRRSEGRITPPLLAFRTQKGTLEWS